MNVALMRRMEWRGELARIETDTAAPLGSHDVSAGLNLLSHCRFASCAHQDGERRAGPSIRAITTQVGTTGTALVLAGMRKANNPLSTEALRPPGAITTSAISQGTFEPASCSHTFAPQRGHRCSGAIVTRSGMASGSGCTTARSLGSKR